MRRSRAVRQHVRQVRDRQGGARQGRHPDELGMLAAGQALTRPPRRPACPSEPCMHLQVMAVATASIAHHRAAVEQLDDRVLHDCIVARGLPQPQQVLHLLVGANITCAGVPSDLTPPTARTDRNRIRIRQNAAWLVRASCGVRTVRRTGCRLRWGRSCGAKAALVGFGGSHVGVAVELLAGDGPALVGEV